MKNTTITYTCDLCGQPMGAAPVRIGLQHGASVDICATCVPPHQALLEKMRALIIAATPREQPSQIEDYWRQNARAYGGR